MKLKIQTVLEMAGRAGWLLYRENSPGRITECIHSRSGNSCQQTQNPI